MVAGWGRGRGSTQAGEKDTLACPQAAQRTSWCSCMEKRVERKEWSARWLSAAAAAAAAAVAAAEARELLGEGLRRARK